MGSGTEEQSEAPSRDSSAADVHTCQPTAHADSALSNPPVLVAIAAETTFDDHMMPGEPFAHARGGVGGIEGGRGERDGEGGDGGGSSETEKWTVRFMPSPFLPPRIASCKYVRPPCW